MGPLLGCHAVRQSLMEEISPIPELNHSVSAIVSNSSSPRRGVPQVHVGYSQPSPLQEQAQPGEAIRLWR